MKGGRAFRAPALLVVVGLLIAAMVFERNLRPTPPPATSGELAHVMPVASAADALSTTWFCAGGTARGTKAPDPKEGDVHAIVVAEHTVIITNQADRVQRAKVTVYPNEGAPVVRTFDLSARARFDLVLSDVLHAPYASALVETDGGLVAVEHELDGPLGHAIGPCASSASTSWTFPSGTTRPGARLVYTVFNPFPDQAVLDFDFQVEDDNGRQVQRQSDKLTGLVVKPGQVLPIDVTDIIQVRPRLATHVQVRGNRGRVVVDQLLLVDGEHKDPKQLGVTLGATTAMDSWLFANGEPITQGVDTSIVLYNPGGETVEAEVLVNVDGNAPDLEPFNATVRPGQYTVVSLTEANRLPLGAGYWAIARSRKGGPLFATREQRTTAPAPHPGVAIDLGAPLLATRWLVPLGGLPGTDLGEVTIANPSATRDVTITVSSVADGVVTPIDSFDTVVLAAGERTVVNLDDPAVPGAPAARALRIEATGAVVVSQAFGWSDPAARASLVVFPERDALVVPDAADIQPTFNTPSSVPGPSGGVFGTEPPGTDGGTVVPGSEPPGSGVPASEPPVTDPSDQPATTTAPDPAASTSTFVPPPTP